MLVALRKNPLTKNLEADRLLIIIPPLLGQLFLWVHAEGKKPKTRI